MMIYRKEKKSFVVLINFIFYRDEQQIEELLNNLTASVDETVKRQKTLSDSSPLCCS